MTNRRNIWFSWKFASIAYIIALILSSCKSEITESTKNKILPLGASRVEGDRPAFESYRYELWKMLVDSSWQFDFIGTMEDDAVYPRYNTKRFDNDHEGRSGWTAKEIRYGLPYWTDGELIPDIVLYSSPGGNDILQGEDLNEILENIEAIIGILQHINPSITIIIEKMAPGTTEFMQQEDLVTVFNQLSEEIPNIAASFSTSTSSIIVVDMYSNFDDSMLADDVHYNKKGSKFIAKRYYNELKEIMIP